MKTTYDPEVDIVRIILKDVPVHESEEASPGVIVDYDAEGNILGFEIMNASKRVGNPREMSYAITA